MIWRAAFVTDIVELSSTWTVGMALGQAQTRGDTDNGQTATPSGSRCTNLQTLVRFTFNTLIEHGANPNVSTVATRVDNLDAQGRGAMECT